MKKNVGKIDRRVRLTLGILILAVHYVYYAITGYYCVWANIGYIFLLTGLFRFCPPYKLFKIDTTKKDK